MVGFEQAVPPLGLVLHGGSDADQGLVDNAWHDRSCSTDRATRSTAMVASPWEPLGLARGHAVSLVYS